MAGTGLDPKAGSEQTRTHPPTHPPTHARTHTHAHSHTRTHTHTHTRTRTLVHTRTLIHTRTRTHTHTHTHTHTQTNKQTNKHTHTSSCPGPPHTHAHNCAAPQSVVCSPTQCCVQPHMFCVCWGALRPGLGRTAAAPGRPECPSLALRCPMPPPAHNPCPALPFR